jgi:hypothetical protein
LVEEEDDYMFRFGLLRFTCRLFSGLALVYCLLGSSLVAAQDAATLMKDANQAYRDAEKALFAGKHEEARGSLAQAESMIGQALLLSPDNAQAKSLQSRVNQLSKRLPKRDTTPAAPPKEAVPGATPVGGAVAEVPSGAVTYLRQLDQQLDKATDLLGEKGATYSLDYREKAAEASLKEAKGALETIEKRHGAKMGMDHPELKARREHIAELEKRIAAFKSEQTGAAVAKAAADEASQTASAPWVELLRPYIIANYSPGHVPEKYLISSATMEEEEMRKRLGIFADASADHQKYKQSGLKNPTIELDEIDRKLGESIAEFRKSMLDYGIQILKEVEESVGHARRYQEEQEAKRQKGEAFNLQQKDILPNLREKLSGADIYFPKESQEAKALLKQIEELEKVDGDHRKQRVADTRMRPEKYTGADKADIEKLAREITEKDVPNAKILRVAVVWSEWREEARYEYTDTTRTALRYRVTRRVVVETAAKGADGCFLLTLHIEKERLTDGTWSKPSGHVMHSDAILEENVNK